MNFKKHCRAHLGTSTQRIIYSLGIALVTFGTYMFDAWAQKPGNPDAVKERAERFKRMSRENEERGLAEPFKGITTDGKVVPGLFPVRSTGISTKPVMTAAEAFIATLTPQQRTNILFRENDPEWRKWMNQHFYIRQGISFKEMSDPQREAAFKLLRESLSAKGLKQTRDIMRLNHTLGELNNDNFEEYGEWLYWITIMGTPSDKEPWGWQLDGHHLNINYFVLGDQVVMTPTFMGSEPVVAKSGKHSGTSVLQEEQNKGLALINALDDAQRRKAIVQASKTNNNNLSEAFKDNILVEYAGLAASEMNKGQKEQFLDLIHEYVRNMSDGHANVKMDEVKKHLDATHFAWIGGTETNSVYYYRIHSPVVLIEFDHQSPIALKHLERGKPTREHIHSVIRTPNGNDYGKDLLRQHYETHPHLHEH